MVKYFTVDMLRQLTDHKDNIRNITLIGYRYHGKSALTDYLAEVAGIIPERVLTKDKDPEHTIKLYYKNTEDGNEYLVNLIHHFSKKALRISDGALLVVGCYRDLTERAERYVRRGLTIGGFMPVLAISKIDFYFLDPCMDAETVYQIFKGIIDTFADLQIDPRNGNVVFFSAWLGWGFTLKSIARKLCSNVDESDLLPRLWGDNFYDEKTKEYCSEHNGSPNCERTFVSLVCKPIFAVIEKCLIVGRKPQLWGLLKYHGVVLNSEERELTGGALIKSVMRKWFPLSEALFDAIVCHLPSPSASASASAFRVKRIKL